MGRLQGQVRRLPATDGKRSWCIDFFNLICPCYRKNLSASFHSLLWKTTKRLETFLKPNRGSDTKDGRFILMQKMSVELTKAKYGGFLWGWALVESKRSRPFWNFVGRADYFWLFIGPGRTVCVDSSPTRRVGDCWHSYTMWERRNMTNILIFKPRDDSIQSIKLKSLIPQQQQVIHFEIASFPELFAIIQHSNVMVGRNFEIDWPRCPKNVFLPSSCGWWELTCRLMVAGDAWLVGPPRPYHGRLLRGLRIDPSRAWAGYHVVDRSPKAYANQ